MGRHRHITCVRSDGLSTVLASLLEDRRVVAATLVDLGSGFILDACSRDPDLTDLELLGAGHAELARAVPALTAERPGAGVTLTVETDDGRVHLLREIPDPHGDALVLAVVLTGGNARSVARTRQRMAAVPVEALTAGPTLQRRPVDGRWQVDPAAPDVPAVPPEGLPGLEPHPTAGAARPEGLPGLEPVIPKGPAPTGGLPGLDPVVPKVHRTDPEPTPADTPAAMVPVVVTPARERARWAGETPGDDDDPEPPVPTPREEPAGADV